MKAAILQTQGKLDIVDLSIDKPQRREVLIRTIGSGLCHSDLHAIDAPMARPMAVVPGHEASGIVEQVGEDVTYVKPGDHVITFLVQFCGACEYCLNGKPTLCARPVGARAKDSAPRLTYDGKPVGQFTNLGGFAELMLVHEHAVAKIDKEYPFDRAAVIGCGMCTGLGSVLNSAKVRAGSTVAVIGAGGVGMSAVQGARVAGARRIIVVDVEASKAEHAKKAGATDFVNAKDGDPVKQIMDLTGGGVDYSFECLGLKETCEQAVKVLRAGGLATIIGIGGGDFAVNAGFILRGRRVQGAFMGDNNFRADMQNYIDLDRQGKIDVGSLIEKHIHLNDINDGYDAMRARQIQGRRVIMFPT